MSLATIIRKPSAFIPIAMSLAAISVLLGYLVLHGPAPQADEGGAAHLFQLLLVAQLPVVAYFALRWLPRFPKQAFEVLVLQAAAGLAALAPVFIFHW
jgi:hypothetical protein